MSRTSGIYLSFLVSFMATGITAQEQPHAFLGATIYPISGPQIENGVLIIRNGDILSVGSQNSVAIPQGATRHDVSGKVILPGLVDTHSHIGQPAGGDASATLHPDVRVIDAFDVRHSSLQRARAGGITTVNVMSGSGHLMSGQTVYLKLRKGNTIRDLTFCGDLLNDICGGLKMANGTNSLAGKPFSGTRGKSAALVRGLYIKAQEYQANIDAANGDREKMPERDLQMETLVQVLQRRRIVHHHTHRHDDIMTVIRLAREFDFSVVIHHGSEAWKVVDEIAEAGIPCSIIMLDAPGGKLEAVDLRFETSAILEEAGIDVAFHTDDPITDSRLFLRSAAFGVRAGMSREKALEALTLAGARMLGLQARVGSLDAGKNADFIVLSGSPLSLYTHVEQTWVEGHLVFDRSNPDDRKFAVGAYGVFRDNEGSSHFARGIE